MKNGVKAGKNSGYTCNTCSEAFKADKNSASITVGETETYFCSTDCLKQYWAETDKNNKA